MPLTVLTGRPNAGMTALVHDMIREAVAGHRSAVLLLPTLPDVRRARHALAATCPIGLNVGQFDRLVESMWATYGDGRRAVREVERRALVGRAWADVGSGSAPGPGMLGVLCTLARRAGERDAVVPPVTLAPETKSLTETLARYRALLGQAGLIEPGGAARMLARSAPAPADLVVVHRFTDFGPAQVEVLISWATTTRVVVTLVYDPDVPATAVVGSLVERLRAAGAEVRAIPPRFAGDPELAALESRLFAPGPRIAAGGAVRLALAEGAEAEARLAVRHVERALADGTPADRVALAFRDPARHYPWVRRVFAERGIAADYDVSIPAGETPIGRAFLDLFGFAAGGFARSDLEAFLRSPFAATPTHVVDGADEQWRRSRAPDGRGLTDALGTGAPATALARTAIALARRPLDREAAVEWQKLANQLLANGYAGTAPTIRDEESIDAAAHRALISTVEVLSSLESSTAADAIAAFRDARVSPSALERPGHVQVLGVERLRSRRFDVAILGGLTASEFPRRSTGDALEGDVVQAAMRALGLAYGQSEELARERLLFYLAVTRPRVSLTLLRQAGDEEGRVLRESVFWDELLDMYRDPDDVDDMRGPKPEELLMGEVAGVEVTESGPCTRRGVLTDPRVTEELARLDVVSASDIEAYLACPYAWYVERVLRPSRPDADLDARTRGAAAHEAILRFYEALPGATGSLRVTPGNLPVALGLVPPAVRAALASVPSPRDLEETQALAAVERRVRGIVERDADFLPEHTPLVHEWGFGRGDDTPVDLGAFRLRGRVDRIDDGPGGLVVIDYKGSSVTPLAKLREERKVQLQLYAVAAGRRFGRPVAGGLYRSMSAPKDRGFIDDSIEGPGLVRTDRLDGPGIEALLAEAVVTASEAVEGMRAGRIAARPDEPRCSYCVASGFCGEAAR